MATHVKVLGALYLCFGAAFALIAIGASFFTGGLAGIISNSGEEGAPLGAALVGMAGVAVTGLLLLAAVPALLCGWGLLTRRGWARILGIVLAVVAIINPPFGTLFGAYALYVLFSSDTERLFSRGGAEDAETGAR